MASQQEIRRRSSAADRSPVEAEPTVTTTATAPTFAHSRNVSRTGLDDLPVAGRSRAGTETMLPPDDGPYTRKARSTSVASRNANRLSLTLPIAPPNSDPSRPTPTSAAMSSVPATPIDSSAVSSPGEANEFIIAIAAQERRVLELREELSRAEAELTLLKKKWTAQDTNHRRGDRRLAEPFRPMAPASDDDAIAARRSVELDRRKSLLQTQNGAAKGRRVLRGGHTRTLSLLSPAKPDPSVSLLGERGIETFKLPPLERRTAQLINPNLSKRASWQPRTMAQQNPQVVPGLVEDFKLGLRAFVEDIRQITVGDEPINGQPVRSMTSQDDGNVRRHSSSNQDTIRPSQAARPKVSTAFDSPSSTASSPTPSSKPGGTPREKAKSTKNKHFSWTPLGFDSIDDDDWSNWESPAPVKTARWSGSTIGAGNIEDMGAFSDDGDQVGTPLKQRPTLESPLLSPKLEEIIPNMVNRLSPSNLKRTAHNLMDEWEKSLMEPEQPKGECDKENSV